MTEAELRRRARLTTLIALGGVPVGLTLAVFGPDHGRVQSLVIAPAVVLVLVLQYLSSRRLGAGRMLRLDAPDGVRVAPPRYLVGVGVAVCWAGAGLLPGSVLDMIGSPPHPLDPIDYVVLGPVLVTFTASGAAVLVLAVTGTMSLAQGRPYLRLHPDRLEAAGLFLTRVVPWSALGALDVWAPAAPWMRCQGSDVVLVYPLARPELVTYRSRAPFATRLARRRAKQGLFELPCHRLAVIVAGIAEDTREYAQRANLVPDAR